jgi:hypothetical protein
MPSETQQSGRQAILVLGMHRSGTSAVTRVVNLLGAAAPRTLVPADAGNPRGYWESERFYSLHDQMLEAAGSCWYDWQAVNPDWFKTQAANEFKEKIKAAIVSEYHAEPLIVLKDPRICRFLPYYLEILAELEIKPFALHVLRNPLGVAHSLERRDGLPRRTSMLLWLRHVLEAEFHSRQLPRSFMLYEDLLADRQTASGRLANTVGIQWPHRPEEVATEIDEFISSELRHDRSSFEDLRASADVVSWLNQAFDVFIDLAKGKQDSKLLRTLDAIRAEFDKGCLVFGPAKRSSEVLAAQLRSAHLSQAAEVSRLRSGVNALESQINVLVNEVKTAQARAFDSEQKLNSFRFLVKATWKKLVHVPRDLSRKLRRSKKEGVG